MKNTDQLSIVHAAKVAYESAQADFDARKRALWAPRILQAAFGSDAHIFDAAALERGTELLSKAIAKFDIATTSDYGCGAPGMMAAVIAKYFGHEFILDKTLWGFPVEKLAAVERQIDFELSKAYVDALYTVLCKAERDAEASAPTPAEEAV